MILKWLVVTLSFALVFPFTGNAGGLSSVPFTFDRMVFENTARQALASMGAQGGPVFFQEVYQVQRAGPRPMFRDTSRVILLSEPPVIFDPSKPLRLGYYLDYDGNSGLVWINAERPHFEIIYTSLIGARLTPTPNLELVERLKQQILREFPETTVDWKAGQKMFDVVGLSITAAPTLFGLLRQHQDLFQYIGIASPGYLADHAPVFGQATLIPAEATTPNLRDFYTAVSAKLSVGPMSWPPRAIKCNAFLVAP